MGAFLVIDTDEKMDAVKKSLSNEFSVINAEDKKVGIKKAELQKFKGILASVDDDPESIIYLVKTVRATSLNTTTPIILVVEAMTEAIRNFHKYKNVHFIEHSEDAEYLRDQINATFNGQSKKVNALNLDAKLINLFIGAATNTINTMGYASKLADPKPYPYAGELHITPSITAYAELKGKGFKGFFSISFPKQTFLQITKNLLDEVHADINENIQDIAAEFGNIVYGQVKKKLSQIGYKMQPLIPQISLDNNVLVESLDTGPAIIIPFTSDAGEFFICVSLGDIRR